MVLSGNPAIHQIGNARISKERERSCMVVVDQQIPYYGRCYQPREGENVRDGVNVLMAFAPGDLREDVLCGGFWPCLLSENVG